MPSQKQQKPVRPADNMRLFGRAMKENTTKSSDRQKMMQDNAGL
jgi:hypothetical protein